MLRLKPGSSEKATEFFPITLASCASCFLNSVGYKNIPRIFNRQTGFLISSTRHHENNPTVPWCRLQVLQVKLQHLFDGWITR